MEKKETNKETNKDNKQDQKDQKAYKGVDYKTKDLEYKEEYVKLENNLKNRCGRCNTDRYKKVNDNIIIFSNKNRNFCSIWCRVLYIKSNNNLLSTAHLLCKDAKKRYYTNKFQISICVPQCCDVDSFCMSCGMEFKDYELFQYHDCTFKHYADFANSFMYQQTILFSFGNRENININGTQISALKEYYETEEKCFMIDNHNKDFEITHDGVNYLLTDDNITNYYLGIRVKYVIVCILTDFICQNYNLEHISGLAKIIANYIL